MYPGGQHGFPGLLGAVGVGGLGEGEGCAVVGLDGLDGLEGLDGEEEHPEARFLRVAPTEEDQDPPLSCSATQKNAPPLHG